MKVSTVMSILCVLNASVTVALYDWNNEYTALWFALGYLCLCKEDRNDSDGISA
jgi:hypothetical protein